tara:strand:- start:703 stop:1197 length:495 start_codon:yes stop_codon:yes gene_type:complete
MTYLNESYNPILDEKIVSTVNTAAQTVTVTRAIVNGSQIEYTPSGPSTHVLYQCSFQWINEPDDNTHFYVSLVEKNNIGDAWSYVANRSWGVAIVDSSAACSFENVEILLPTWSGSKYLALYIRAHLSSTEGKLHQLKMDSSGYDTGNENFVSTLTTCESLKSS